MVTDWSSIPPSRQLVSPVLDLVVEHAKSRQQFGDALHAMRIHDANHARNDGKGLAADGPVDDVAMALDEPVVPLEPHPGLGS